MILKILLTLALVIAVYIWFRRKNGQPLLPNNLANSLASSMTASRSLPKKTSANSWVKPFAYSMVGLVIAAGILLYYLSWQENHTPYQVTITNPQTGATETFIALKKNMRGRLFVTESGREIKVSDLERIDVRKLAVEKLEVEKRADGSD